MGLLIGANSEPAAAGSLRFYGNNLIDQGRFKVPVTSESLTANIGVGDFTVEMWIRPSATAGDNPRTNQGRGANTGWTFGNIFYDRDAFGQTPGHGLSIGGGDVHFGGDDLSSNAYTIVGTTDLRDGNWHHVAATREVSSGDIALYVDGTREDTQAGALTGNMRLPNSHSPNSTCGAGENLLCDFSDEYMVLGCEKADWPGAELDYIGYISELRLSNSVRYTGTSITVPTSPFVSDANTMALYHFNEGSGTSAADASGNGNTGTLYLDASGPTWSADNPFS